VLVRRLLLVDQFEELFGEPADRERERFLDELRSLCDARDCVVVVTMRADFYDRLMTTALWPVAEHERMEVIPLRGNALRAAIERPALEVGVQVEPTLVERLVADAAREPGSMYLLQETLRILWEQMVWRALPLAAYERLGRDGASGLAVGLSRNADAAIARLDQAQLVIARRIFLRLVQLGEGRDDTRRQQPVTALRAATDDPAAFESTLRLLTAHRLVTMSGAPDTGKALVDLSLEGLIKAWPVLQGWVDEGRASEGFRRGVERDAQEWTDADRDSAMLYRGRRLQAAREWANHHPWEPSASVAAFLAAGTRRHLALRTLAGLLVALLGFGTVRAVTPEVRAYLWHREAASTGPMVQFASGPAVLGAPGLPGQERRQMVLPSFWLDVSEVTNRRYRLCVLAGACTPPLESSDAPSYEQVDPDFPVVFVTAYQAAQFCRWLGRTLPSQAEWERAARGTSGRRWPWGDSRPTADRINQGGAGRDPQGLARESDPAFDRGATRERVRHLIGNAAEWTRTPADCPPDLYACAHLWDGRTKVAALNILGGAWPDGYLPVTETLPGDPGFPDYKVGFRCARAA
jgi:formylglycine-generating enzyme required for sulfatase activity